MANYIGDETLTPEERKATWIESLHIQQIQEQAKSYLC